MILVLLIKVLLIKKPCMFYSISLSNNPITAEYFWRIVGGGGETSYIYMNKVKSSFFENWTVLQNLSWGQCLNLYHQITSERTWKMLCDLYNSFPLELNRLKFISWLITEMFSLIFKDLVVTLHKKWSFTLKISSVNVTKSADICRFGHIYLRNL